MPQLGNLVVGQEVIARHSAFDKCPFLNDFPESVEVHCQAGFAQVRRRRACGYHVSPMAEHAGEEGLLAGGCLFFIDRYGWIVHRLDSESRAGLCR